MLNTAGYRFNQTDLNNRDQYGFRVDYTLSARHKVEGVYSYFKETDDRTDLDFITPRSTPGLHGLRHEAVLAGMALAEKRQLPE